MKVEYDALTRNNTWSLVSCPTNFNIIGFKWIFGLKRHSNGSIQLHKAHLLAKGFNQEEGVDFYDTFNLVVKLATIRCVKVVYDLKEALRTWFNKLNYYLVTWVSGLSIWHIFICTPFFIFHYLCICVYRRLHNHMTQ